MRLVGLAVSAAMISGCSYGGGQGGPLSGFFSGPSQGHYNAQSSANRCQVPHRQSPVPQGCHPSEVTIGGSQSYGQAQSYGQGGGSYNASAGGFPQQPQFGQPDYTTGSYGSHASGNSHSGLHQGRSEPRIRRPKFRGSLDLGVEQSVGGNLLDYGKVAISPITGYDSSDYNEAAVSGSITDGAITRQRWYANSRLASNPNDYDELSMPSVSFDDAWLTPATLGAGGEFILSDKATIFARAGYTRSEGTSGGAASVEGTIFQETTVETYEENLLVGITTGTEFNTGHTVTEFSYDFSDMERIDLEAGGRFYLDPVAGQSTGRTVTPFVSASAGASRYNDVSFTIDQRQLSYSSIYQDPEAEYYDVDVAGYDLDNDPATPATRTVELYDAQWVPMGSLKAGVEWQVTPKTALAFETGLRVEGARDYSNGTKGDTNVTVPLTLRGSFNF